MRFLFVSSRLTMYVAYLVVVLALAFADSVGQTVNSGGPSATLPEISDSLVFPGSWVSDLVYRALDNFTVRDAGSIACQRESEMYDRNLRNYTSWAVRMAESWNRRPIGILTGNRYHMGIYDECVQIHYPVRGQYCLPEIKLMPPTGKNYSFDRTEDKDYFGNNHAWHTVLGWIDYPDQIPRNILNIGICIPDSCSALDLQSTLQRELVKVFIPDNVKSVVKVDPKMCTISGDMYPYSTAYYVTSAIFLLLVMICCGATLHHFIVLLYQQNKKEISEDSDSYLSSFSFIKSIKELSKFNKNNELNILNGLKLQTMLFILFGHRFMYFVGYPVTYFEEFEKIYLYGPNVVITSSNIVDPFFFMSGYLLYLTITPVFMKSAGTVWMKLTSPIIYRIFRMLPAYCAMMAIVAHIVPHLGDGPLWPHNIWHEAENCKNYWWTNILFISNYIDVKYQCLLMSWYISSDVQFFIIGIILLYVYTKNNKLGIGLLITILCLSFFVPFIIMLLTKAEGILKVHIPFLENPRSSKVFNEVYRSSHMRGLPFFSGLATAILIKKLKEKHIKFSQITVHVGTLTMIIISMSVQLYGAKFYKRHRPYNLLEHALYSTMSHCTWSILATWIFVCHFTSGYGPFAKLLSNRFVVPLGRLSYSVFLVNLIVMAISQSTHRLPTYPTVQSLLNAWIYDSFKSYLVALALYLVVEAPFTDVTRKIFGREPKKIIDEIPMAITNNTAEVPI